MMNLLETDDACLQAPNSRACQLRFDWKCAYGGSPKEKWKYQCPQEKKSHRDEDGFPQACAACHPINAALINHRLVLSDQEEGVEAVIDPALATMNQITELPQPAWSRCSRSCRPGRPCSRL